MPCVDFPHICSEIFKNEKHLLCSSQLFSRPLLAVIAYPCPLPMGSNHAVFPAPSSHPVSWTMRGNGIVEFHFNDINLPDSTSNEPGSHGFVKFSVKPQPSLQLNDAVDNTAHIVFDFNAPITTNTARTLIVEVEVSVQEQRPQGVLLLSPNPVSNFLRISLPSEKAHEMVVGPLQVFDDNGKFVLSQSHPCNGCTVDVSRLPSGSYFMLWKTKQGDFVGKFEKL